MLIYLKKIKKNLIEPELKSFDRNEISIFQRLYSDEVEANKLYANNIFIFLLFHIKGIDIDI